ncbi:MAG: toxin HicA [Chitinivibrionia bacterium]|nr:toxin HicA [Chitinivibrionia bacterium]
MDYKKEDRNWQNSKNIKFIDLLNVCKKYFGEPRIRGSHHIFKTPWQGDPRINIQKYGNTAKPYQVKAVIEAIKKLENGGYL